MSRRWRVQLSVNTIRIERCAVDERSQRGKYGRVQDELVCWILRLWLQGRRLRRRCRRLLGGFQASFSWSLDVDADPCLETDRSRDGAIDIVRRHRPRAEDALRLI